MFPNMHITAVLCLFVAVPSTANQHQATASHGLNEEVADAFLQNVTGVDNAEIMLLQQGISMRKRSWPARDGTKTTLLESDGHASKQKKAVLVLLFLARDSLPHLRLWQDWSASAPKGSWHAFLHCVDYIACKQGTLASWPELTLVPTVPSSAVSDLLSPMHQLLKHALNASPNPHGGVPLKFIFLSETTLPMKPFADVHKELGREDFTDICFYPFTPDAPGPLGGLQSIIGGRSVKHWPWSMALDPHGAARKLELPLHSQWVVLRRNDAEAFVQEWVPGQSGKTGWAVPLKGGHFEGENRTVPSKTFVGTVTQSLDEYATFASIYGAYQSNGQQDIYYPAMGLSIGAQVSHLSYQGRCRTHVPWLEEELPDCPDMKYTNSSFMTNKTGHSPIVIDSADRCLLQQMRDSWFLFMRKFAIGSVRRDDFHETILK